jgi:hypothetical protein
MASTNKYQPGSVMMRTDEHLTDQGERCRVGDNTPKFHLPLPGRLRDGRDPAKDRFTTAPSRRW